MSILPAISLLFSTNLFLQVWLWELKTTLGKKKTKCSLKFTNVKRCTGKLTVTAGIRHQLLVTKCHDVITWHTRHDFNNIFHKQKKSKCLTFKVLRLTAVSSSSSWIPWDLSETTAQKVTATNMPKPNFPIKWPTKELARSVPPAYEARPVALQCPLYLFNVLFERTD
jgi:hypothetical protein